LKVNRINQAEKVLKKMMDINEEATLTKLISAYVSLSIGGDKSQDAENTFQELIEKYGETVTLLNGKAACYLQIGDYQKAHKELLKALSKRSNDPETLINLIVCSQHLKKSTDLIQRYLRYLFLKIN
jgi:coatomer subunit epsilon